MAKAKKVSGVKVFLTENEAMSLSCLLRQGVENSVLETLNLEGFSQELYREAYWKSVDFVSKASLTKED
jgi:hypothetical protein